MCNEAGKGVKHKGLKSLSVRVKPFIVRELRAKSSAIQKLYLQKNSFILWVCFFFPFQYIHISCFHHRVFKQIWISLYIRRAGCHIEKLVSLLFRQWCPGAGHLSSGEECYMFRNFMGWCCCCSGAKSCPTLCSPMTWSTPRLPCPSLSPGVCSDSCPLSR